MARIMYFREYRIAIYVYGELYGKHHEKHVLVLKADEDCQYDFSGRPIKNTRRLRSKEEHKIVSEWIRSHASYLEESWNRINQGKAPRKLKR